MAKGWIKLHRKLFDNPVLTRSRVFSDLEAWIWIITNVNHEKAKVLIGADVMDCNRGEMITSQKKLCMIFRWGNSKLRNFLKRLQKCQMISFETTSKLTLIAVIKYDTYQSSQTDSKLILNRNQIDNKSKTNTNKNEKNVKNVKNDKETDLMFDKFWNLYPRKVNKKKTSITFNRLNKDNKEKAIEGAEAYKEHVKQNKVEIRFVMHPTTFLNGENWDDYIHGQLQQVRPEMFRTDAVNPKFLIGFCSKCGSCDSYDGKSILFEDSRCCSATLTPERINKA
jgi:uncharacterized protein YifE (UPF0438 family)